jgi:SAM-dependent methyltransferase
MESEIIKGFNIVPHSKQPDLEIDGATVPVSCIACGQAAFALGDVPYSYHFLHHHFSEPLDGGVLYECSGCGLWFKYPYIPEEQIAEFYRTSANGYTWDKYNFRPDFACAVRAISQALPEGGTVLDFGCYQGAFLRSLPDRFMKRGIEPSEAAAQVASRRDIEILGKDLSVLGNHEFDAITLFDVFEHLTQPLDTLDDLFGHIRPGGLLCIGTGFADSPAFRRSAAKYSYVCAPEHCCFLTRAFLTFLGDRYNSECEVFSIKRTPRSVRHLVRTLGINCVNSPTLLLKSRKTIFKYYPTHALRVISSRGLLPLWATADHVVAVFRKNKTH